MPSEQKFVVWLPINGEQVFLLGIDIGNKSLYIDINKGGGVDAYIDNENICLPYKHNRIPSWKGWFF